MSRKAPELTDEQLRKIRKALLVVVINFENTTKRELTQFASGYCGFPVTTKQIHKELDYYVDNEIIGVYRQGRTYRYKLV